MAGLTGEQPPPKPGLLQNTAVQVVGGSVVVLFLAAVAVTLLQGGDDPRRDVERITLEDLTTTTGSTPRGRAVASLEELLTPAIDGATPVPDLTGPLDLATAAALDEELEEDVRRLLERLEFASGWRHGWTLADGRVYLETVLEFATPENASEYEDALVESTGRNPGAVLEPLEGGSIVTYSFTDPVDGELFGSEAYFAVGHRVFSLVLVAFEPSDTAAELRARGPALAAGAR